MAGGSAPHDSLGEPAQVLHEHDPKGDGDGPELADGQRLHSLESANEALEGLGLEPAVGVRDEAPGQVQYAWIPLQGVLRELGELAVEPPREILPDLPDHRVDDVKVVDEPFRGRSGCPFVTDHRGDLSIALEQGARAVPDGRRQAATGLAVGQNALTRDALRVFLEPLRAEQVGPDGVLGAGHERGRGSFGGRTHRGRGSR